MTTKTQRERAKSTARSPHVPSTGWATTALADSWDLMADAVPAAWKPVLESVTAYSARRLSGSVHQYGCGMYGCVFQTADPEVVLKVTTDETEAEFAHELAGTLVRPICVYYHSVISLNASYDGRPIYLLWREAASQVGKIGEALGPPAHGLINNQHHIAQDALRAIWQGAPTEMIRSALSEWVKSCEVMARQKTVPALRELGDGLVEIYGQQKIFFGDIHAGNVGLVHRVDGPHWVVTDPGKIVVVDL